MWMTPFSGPSQRSWLSPVRRREKRTEVAEHLVDRQPDHQRRQRPDGGDLDVVAAARR